MEKAFEELQIKDDFMFSVIMRHPKFCKPFLERILGIKISRIEYPKSQETIDISADAKSVRLDIYVEDEKNSVYNIEMQTTRNRNLPKRSRYYHYPNFYKIQTLLSEKYLLLNIFQIIKFGFYFSCMISLP